MGDTTQLAAPQRVFLPLRTARRIAGLTQLQLAQRAGVSDAFVSLLEAGKQDIHGVAYEIVVRLAHALGVEPTELWPVSALTLVTPEPAPPAAAPTETIDA